MDLFYSDAKFYLLSLLPFQAFVTNSNTVVSTLFV